MNALFPIPPPLELAPIVTETDRQLRGRLWQFKLVDDQQGYVLTEATPSFDDSQQLPQPTAVPLQEVQ